MVRGSILLIHFTLSNALNIYDENSDALLYFDCFAADNVFCILYCMAIGFILVMFSPCLSYIGIP